MSRARFLLLLVAIFPSAAIAACSGDDTNPPNPFSPGGGTDATTASDGPALQDTAPPDINLPRETGGGTLPIQCGQTTCNATNQDCCIGGGGGLTCQTKGTCPGSSLSCSDKASCTGGQVCCAAVERADAGDVDAGDDGGDGGGGGIVSVKATCAATCPKGDLQLCNTAADCAPGDECRRGTNGLKACRKPTPDGGNDASLDAPADG